MATATTVQPEIQNVNITIGLSDMSVLKEIKKALKLFRGVELVKTSTPQVRTSAKVARYKEALEDVRAGRVTKWDSVDQMFDTLMKENFQTG